MGKTEQSKTYHTSQLIETAIEQLKYSYTPYSGFKVGAALLAKNGTVYTGCNIENAAYTPTNCAERTAFFKAVSEGVKEFDAICIVGGKNGVLTEYAPPCGVCRQVMMEHSNDLKKHRWIQISAYILAVLIILSTMFLKQHSVTDVIAAVTMACIIYPFVYVTADKKAPKLSQQPT